MLRQSAAPSALATPFVFPVLGPERSPLRCRCGAELARPQRQDEYEFETPQADTAWVADRIKRGETDANRLTNAVFWRRHPALNGQKIRADQRDLANEWLAILRDVVKPQLARTLGVHAVSKGDVAAVLKLSAKQVPGLGLTVRALLEKHQRTMSPELPLEVLLAFVYREAGSQLFDNVTSGVTRNGKYNPSPAFYELGAFQTPAGLHGCRSEAGKKTCAHPVPGKDVERSELGKVWKALTGRFPDKNTWRDPETQVRVGLHSLTTTAERVRKDFPALFTSKQTDWYVRMAVLYSFAAGAGWTRAFLKQYSRELAQLPESKRWEFLRGKSATLSGRGAKTFSPENVDKKMALAAQLRAAGASNTGSGGAPSTSTVKGAAVTPAPTGSAGATRPASGTVEVRRSFPTNPPLKSSPGKRDPRTYDAILDQFAVGVNPRYAHRNGATFCNIYVWDVTRAMGAEIPHWTLRNGDRAVHRAPGANELNANAVNLWLNKHGERHDWRRVDLATAVARASSGFPTVASHRKTGGIGHVAMIRPGDAPPAEGPWMAQAGAINSNRIRLYRVWKRSTPVEFWTHD